MIEIVRRGLVAMTLDEARMFLRDDHAAFVRWCEAATAICNSPDSSFEDWLLCLSRRGLPAEVGACKLYALTKRRFRDDTTDAFITDAQDWRDYLRNENLIS